LSFVILSKDSESTRDVRNALSSTVGARVLSESDSPEQVLSDISRLRPSAVVITLKPEHSENNFALIRKFVTAVPGTAIITAARDSSPSLILGSMRAGALEFLQLPAVQDELQTVLDRVKEFCASQEVGT